MALLSTEKPRWHKALDNLKQFASLQARLENELSDTRRELSQLRGDYLKLGLRCSELASERDALRRRVSESEQYIEALHVESGAAGVAQFDAGEELHERLASLQEHLEQAQRSYGQLETQLAERGRNIEMLQDRVATRQARETELVAELQQMQQRLGDVERDNAAGSEKYQSMLAELGSLRASAADAAVRQHQQIDELQQRLDESMAVRAELERTGQARDRQLDVLHEELAEVRAKLAEVQAGYRDLEIARAERDQEFGILEERLSAHRTREIELDAQYTELTRRYSTAEREHATASDNDRQQLELLQRRMAALLTDCNTARAENQTLQTTLAETTADADNNRAQRNELEQKLAEAVAAGDVLQDNLLQFESERYRLLSTVSELTESLGDTRNQLQTEESAREALVGARNRERWMLLVVLAIAFVLLAGLLLEYSGLWRDSTALSGDVTDARHTVIRKATLPGSGNAAGTVAGTEPLVTAYLMGNGEALSGLENGCARWSNAGDNCLALDASAFDESVIHLDSGVKYRVVSNGTGEAPRPGDSVVMRYRGTRLNGTEFDNSDRRGGAVTLGIDELIPGLREALQRMKAGARWVVYVPAELGDPEFGGPDGEAVALDVELVAVLEPGDG